VDTGFPSDHAPTLDFDHVYHFRSKRSEVIVIYICFNILIWRESFSAK